MGKIKIAIAEDHKLVRQTVARSLEMEPGFRVVGQADDGSQLMPIVKRERPDVIVLDIDMPVMDGWEVLDELRKTGARAKVVVLSMYVDSQTTTDLVNRGARGILPKNADFNNLINAIHEVANSGYYFSKQVSLHLVEDLIVRQQIRPTFASPKLDLQEIQLLDLLCQDRMLKEIADIMAVSPRTLERYKTSLYEKTRAKTMVGLVLFAIKHNYFSPQKSFQN